MKIKGKKPGTSIETLVLPRHDGDIVIQARAVLDYTPFEKIVPEPKPPVKLLAGGKKVPNFEDPTYIASQRLYGGQRMAWMVLESLKETPDLEWETVNLSDPTTWVKWEEELGESGFSRVEIHRILECVMTANCMNDRKLEEARARFLAGQLEEANHSSSLQQEHVNTPFGEPVSG